MKFKGKKLDGPRDEIIVIPRQDMEIVITVRGIRDYEEFDAMCPVPLAPMITKPGGHQFQDDKDEKFIQEFDDWASKRSAWIFYKALSPTKELEFETVDPKDPETFTNIHKELAGAFVTNELASILGAVSNACGLNQERIVEATKRFLATREKESKDESSQEVGQQSTPSGEPVKPSK